MSKLKTPRGKTLAIIAASVLAIGALSTGGAVAADTIGARDIRSNAVRSQHIKDGEVKKRDLAPGVQRLLDQAGKPGKTGPRGPIGPAGPRGAKGEPGNPASDVNGGLEGEVTGTVTIAHIGGRFADRATEVGTLTLPPGTYLVNAYAHFDRVDDTQASTPVLQPSVRGVDAWVAGEITRRGDEATGATLTGDYAA